MKCPSVCYICLYIYIWLHVPVILFFFFFEELNYNREQEKHMLYLKYAHLLLLCVRRHSPAIRYLAWVFTQEQRVCHNYSQIFKY